MANSCHRISPQDIAFVTTSTGSVWESYSQALLYSRFPESKHVLIDGRKGWSSLRFLESIRSLEERIVVLVDEDCFVFDRDQLVILASNLVQSEKAIFLGTPDGGTFHRDHNPFACNTFFLMIKREALFELIRANSNWRALSFSDVQHKSVSTHLGQIDGDRIQFDEFEPYYPIFWLTLVSGNEILYEIPNIDSNLLASTIRLEGFQTDLLIHMWWMRKWKDQHPNPYLGIDHATRYRRLKRLLDEKYFSSRKMRALLFKKNLLRIFRMIHSRLRFS